VVCHGLGRFNSPGNWVPPTVPTGIASFGASSGTVPIISVPTTIVAINFLSSALHYNFGITDNFTITGASGITNSSGLGQTFVVLPAATMLFQNSTAGGSTTAFSNRGGTIVFNNSTAGGATAENQVSGSGTVTGTINFVDGHAGASVISNNFGSASINFLGGSNGDSATLNNSSSGGAIVFSDTSNAGSAVITNFSAGSFTTFQGSSSAGSATVTTDSATTINFIGASTGGQARFIVNGGGTLDISAVSGTGMTSGSIEGAGSFLLGSKQLTTGLNNLSTTVGGVIADGGAAGGAGGSLNKAGSGTLTLTGQNTYTGGTTISGGVLQLGNGGTTGSIPGNVTDNATLSFDHSNAITFPGVISGTGDVTQIGAGTTILTGDNTYTGTTTISVGKLQLGNGGTSGGIQGNIVNNAALVFNRVDMLTVPGVISGIGSVTQAGTGTTILTGNSTYAGGTTIALGTLQLGNGGTSGGIQGDVTDNGTLAFNRSDAVTFPGVISGTGSVAQNGTGTTILIGENTYTGGTTINTGTLQLGNGGTAGSIQGDVANNGTLAFNRSDIVTFPGVISGTGNVTQIGTGTTILTGDSTYTGTTTISAGILQLGNGGTTGSIDGDVTNNASLVFNRSNPLTFPGVISGTGSITQMGAGTTVLTGNSTYTGGTTISAGTLQLGNGGTTGSIQGNVANNGNLVFNRSDTLVFPGVISGTGRVAQTGMGTTVLTAISTYSGTTAITAGALAVGDANHASAALTGGGPIVIAPQGTLGGYGTVAGPVTNNGTIAVGSALPAFSGGPFGTLTINGGTTTFASGSQVHFNTFLNDGSVQNTDVLAFTNSTGIIGQALVSVTNTGGPGGLTLNDGIGLVQNVGGTIPTGNSFRLAAPVEAGAFEYLLFKGDVVGTAANAGNYYLRSGLIIQPGQPVVIPPDSLPPVLDALASQVAGSGTGAIPVVVSTSEGERTLALVPFYRPAAGVYAATPGVTRAMGMQILGTFHDRAGEQSLIAGNGINNSGWLPSVWGRGFGSTLNQSWTGTTTPRFQGSVYGFQTGFDVLRFESIPGHRDYIGLFAGYTGAQGDVSGRIIGSIALQLGSMPVHAANVGAYWTHVGPGEWYVDTVLMGSFYGGNAEAFTGAKADIGGNGFTGSVEGGYPIRLGSTWQLEPQGQVIYQALGLNNTDDGVSSIKFHTADSVTFRGGLRLQDTIPLAGGEVLQPYGRLNIWHTVGATDRIILGTDTITAGHAATNVEVQGGLVAKWTQNLAFWGNVSYTASVTSQRYIAVGGTLGLRYTFGGPTVPSPVIPVAAPMPAPARTYLVFFDWDKADLTARARQIITEAAQNSSRVQVTRIEVNGHADRTGSAAYNQALSERRARNVAAELVRDGVPQHIITVQGFGYARPLVPTAAGVREPQNRRVEIILQ
jgi:autotransporter-associated beta strand protein